jgi:hypothetical protein
MKNLISKGFIVGAVLLLVALAAGQLISFLLAPATYAAFMALLPKYLSMIAFWGPIVGVIAGVFVWTTMNLLGFKSLEEIRVESVEQNNPAPAIVFVGTLIAGILFLMLVIRP